MTFTAKKVINIRVLPLRRSLADGGSMPLGSIGRCQARKPSMASYDDPTTIHFHVVHRDEDDEGSKEATHGQIGITSSAFAHLPLFSFAHHPHARPPSCLPLVESSSSASDVFDVNLQATNLKMNVVCVQPHVPTSSDMLPTQLSTSRNVVVERPQEIFIPSSNPYRCTHDRILRCIIDKR